MDHPEKTAKEIGTELGVDTSTVFYWIRKLSRQGVI